MKRSLFLQVLLATLLCLVHQAKSNKPPRFIQFSSNFFLNEDEPIGKIIGSLEAADEDDDQLDFKINSEVVKSIIELRRTGPKTMDMVLIDKLDRERVDEYTAMIQVTDGVNPIQKPASIYVIDVNDNPPSFINLPYRAEIPEDSLLGSFVYKVSATDPDTGLLGLVSYNITTRQGLFTIDTANGEVSLSDRLDYELEKFYQVELIATDGGGLNRTTDLNVNVLDVQDTPPFFLNLPYRASIYEDAAVGSPVLKVSAMDGDRGVPNNVNYTFVGGDVECFAIDPDTGEVTIKKQINREDPAVLENSGVMEITVRTNEVTDNPKGPTTADALMTIRIMDINDQAPTFNQTDYQATVLENTQARIPVTFLPIGTEMIVSDWDQGDNGRFELYLEKDGVPFEVFEVFPDRVLNEGNALIRVKNSTALDYEAVKEYSFNVIAREYLTTEKRESSVAMTIQLEDVNDNWPEFSSTVFRVDLPENSAQGTSVTKITAEDKDSGVYGDLTYSIGGRSAKLFTVDPNSGEVTVAVDADLDLALLDRETLDTHSLTFQAKDGGGLQTTVQLEITLTDVNDNAPDIARNQYEGYISENEADLDRDVIIEAIDIDLPPNNNVRFSITSGDPLGNFTIGETSGKIEVTGVLDYESMEPALNGVYTLTVTALDMGDTPLSSTTTVLITVQDENDETPYFEKIMYTSILAENSTSGTDVAQVVARDDDGTDPNNEIIYRIESGARDKFRIDAGNGKITVESGANLDRDLYGKEYQLKVLAIDRGTPPTTGTTSVTVTITDVNNKHPVFNPTQRSVKIPEDTAVGKVVFTYRAVDADENSLLRYSLLDDEVRGEDEDGDDYQDKDYLQALFGVHSSNGSVYVKSKLSREIVEEITVTVLVEDVNAEQPAVQNTTAKLVITLGDVNDNPPEFVPDAVYFASVSEASQPGVEVTRVVAVDKDKNPGPIRYYISFDSEESKAFDITDGNRETGIITLFRKVNREDHQFINITVEASDSGNPPMTSYATVNIEIQDVNDNSPEWRTFESPVYVMENATLDTVVTQVSATDKDSGEFGHVMYFITNGDPNGQFGINNETGLVMTKGGLDREELDEFELTIEARDNNNAALVQQRKTANYLKVILRDVNDNAPEFEKPVYVAEIQENAKVTQRVVSVRATDGDQGKNSQIEYSIDNNQGNATQLFDVNPGNGDVTVKKALMGNIGYFMLIVVATDKGSPPKFNTTLVQVFVEDVNDHKPVISRPPENTTLFLMENAPIGYWVTQVYAEDKDSGVNGIVEYEIIETPNNQDWKKFSISKKDGNITTNAEIDRESQETYFIEVRVYDLGKPRFEDRRTLTLVALDQDDNPPFFDREQYPPPYTVSVEEQRSNIFVKTINIAEDPDSGNNSLVCYYLVGGDEEWKHHFRLTKMTGDLWLEKVIDREVVPSVSLVVKASDDCYTGTWERPENQNVAWNSSDVTLLLIEVNIMDINDNTPKFTKPWFTAGVTKDTQFEEQVLNLMEYALDPDEGSNAVMKFHIMPPFRISGPLRERLRERGEDTPFTLGESDGVIRTNIYFQSDMQGYIDFEVKVQDSNPAHADRSNVSIYLLNEEQRVKVIIRGDTNYVGTFKDLFSEFLSNITGAIINVDKIMTHQDPDGKPDIRKTDMFIHAINSKTGEVLDAQVLIDLIDKNYIHLVELFNQYNVIEIQPAVTVVSSGPIESDLQLALILVAVVLAVLIIIVTATFIFCRRKYKRKLKAANAMAFGTRGENGLNKLEMPGTNLHTFEGSNPIWLEQYENGWPRDSDTESKNSMDDNMIDPAALPKHGPNGLDVQEMSMDMYNDEFDHYNRAPASKQKRDADAYLRAAIQQHEATLPRQNGINNHNHHAPNHAPHANTNGHSRTKMNGGPPSNGQVAHNRSVYDNRAFRPDQLQATEI